MTMSGDGLQPLTRTVAGGTPGTQPTTAPATLPDAADSQLASSDAQLATVGGQPTLAQLQALNSTLESVHSLRTVPPSLMQLAQYQGDPDFQDFDDFMSQ